MNEDLVKVITEAFPEAFSLACIIMPIVLFIPITSFFISFITDVATDRRNYKRSWHAARRTEYKQKPHIPSDCELWVKDFEEKEGISIYG